MTRPLPLALALLIGCDLDDSDLSIQTAGSNDAMGWEVAGGFHVDYDSQSDVAVAAMYDDTVYFFSDITSGGTIDETSASGSFVGQAGGEAGWSMDTGPLVGSGVVGVLLQDIMIGAPSESGGKGRVYVLEGGTLDTTTNATGYVTFVGEDTGDYAGWDVAVGDYNGDDLQDVLIGACGNDENGTFAGAVYVVYGSFLSHQGTEIDLKDADVIIHGETIGGGFGCQVAAGDLNNDGQDEIIVGAPGENNQGKGHTYAIFEVGNGRFDISDLTGSTVRWKGENATQTLGSSLDTGDYNGDGIDDLIVSGWHSVCREIEDQGTGTCSATVNPGEVYVVLGVSKTLSSSINFNGGVITNDTNVQFTSTNVTADFGHEVSFLGDVNGDGYDDVAVGAKGENMAYMWLGRPTTATYWISSADDTQANLSIDGSTSGTSGVGYSIRPGGDINNDGRAETIIGSPGFDWYPDTSSSGRADIFLGGSTASFTP